MTTTNDDVDEDLRARADAFKPTYAELRAEGLPKSTIDTLMLSRDAMLTMPGREVAEWIALSSETLTETDVWPKGRPPHWDQS